MKNSHISIIALDFIRPFLAMPKLKQVSLWSFGLTKTFLLSILFLQNVQADNIVGSPKGQFAVSPTGAATYTVSIDVPPGIGGMQPQVSITYNSQSGMGNVGWGCNITGVSAITRGAKDIYHDGIAKGMSYGNDDAYYLDGKRLIYVSGTEGEVGCLYHPEGEPFTDVSIKSGTYGTYFEAKTSEGDSIVYGNDYNSRTIFYSDGQKVAAWHIRSITNSRDRSIYYTYNDTDYYHCVSKITYYTGDTNKTCTVNFSYTSLGTAAQKFRLMNVEGKINKRLTEITCKVGNSLLRRYLFYCDTLATNSQVKFPHLKQVVEKDSVGNTLRPIELTWNEPSSWEKTATAFSLPLEMSNNNMTVTTDNKYLSGDLNSDGITDIITVANVRNENSSTEYSHYNIFMSSVGSSGTPAYLESDTVRLILEPDGYSQFVGTNGSPIVTDFDGDGLNDLILPLTSTHYNTTQILLRVFYGRLLSPATANKQRGGVINFSHPLNVATCYTAADFHNCGKADFLILEEEGTGFSYNCHWIGGTDSICNDSVKTSTLTLPYPPKKVFSQDYNGDGLPDLLVLHENGYKLFWNTGVAVGTFPFSNTTGCYVTGSTVKDAKHVFEGDFDGDGLADILTNEDSDSKLYISYNNGKGTFTKTQVWEHTINSTPKEINGSIIVYDFDHDGKSDVVISDAIRISLSYTDGTTVWLRSNGSTLAKHHETYHFLNEDMVWYNRILGDFSGDGYIQLVNYGRDLYDGVSSTLGLWRYTDSYTPNTKKVNSVVDGFGRSVSFSYESLTKPSVYQKGIGSAYPLVDLIAPLHVVKTTEKSLAVNSSYASLMTETYSYEGFKVHVAGRGLLGFAKTTVANDITGTNVVNETSGWASNPYFIPTCNTTTTYLGSVSSSLHSATATTLKYANKNSGTRKNYFTYPSTVATSDFDNYTTTTTCDYDTIKGVPTLEKTVYDGNTNTNYKQVAYTYGSTKYGRQWLPTQIVRTQRHPNDTQPFSTTQKITYDTTRGLPTQVIDNYGTSLALTKSNSYNGYGNLTSQTVSGAGLSTVTTNYTYDSSNRFVASVTTTPSSTVTNYTYDLWGNVLSETDATVSASPLTTTNTYDGFGNLLTSTSPEGIETSYDMCWNSGTTQKYYIYKTETGKPYHLDYYDSDGRKTYSTTENIDGYEVSEETVYNSKGQVFRKISTDGDFSVMEEHSYDDRGRLISTKRDYMLIGENGFTTSYAYDGRKVTMTDPNGRVSEKTYDAWGLITQSKEPIGTVNYRYKSCGKPSSAAVVGGSTVTMGYDACGNQTRLTDPDAGTTTYTFNAAGHIVTQTDARGIITRDSLDALNRVVKTTAGSTVTTYYYGSSGNAAQRLDSINMSGKTISYGYDTYGRVTSETRNFGNTSYITSYTYDSNNNLQKTTYPGNVEVTYGYNSAGFETSMAVNGSTVWEHLDYDGYNTREKLGSGTTALRRSTTRDDHRLLTGITLQKISNSSTLHAMTFTHNAVTGNLTQRTGMISDGEVFTYDNDDRLVRHQDVGSHYLDNIVQYGLDGNIEFKTGVGDYGYPPGGKPHGVANVTNTSGLLFSDGQQITFNDFSKASVIASDHGGIRYDISYGPDQERWQSDHYYTNMQWPDTVRYYVGDMEGYKVGPSDPVWFYHIGHGVILRKVGNNNNIQPTVYYAFTDNLGSVTRIYDTSGTAVFSAEYDPWGVQRQLSNTIRYNRGYCGHEMLNDLQLINMNGRLYDPYINRFLSPDNYVQLPTSAQSFNRYSYCLNNPLKYVDPDGEFFGWSALTGFIKGIVKVITGKGSMFSPFKYAWKNTINDLKLLAGLYYFDNPKQLLSRFYWELPQTVIGYFYSTIRIDLGYVDKVKHYGGATYLINLKHNNTENGITFGNFINMNTPRSKGIPVDGNGNFSPQKDYMYMHEYGHYLQSQEYGWGYLFSVGIPSLWSHLVNDRFKEYEVSEILPDDGIHNIKATDTYWFEMNANEKASKFFYKRYGIIWSDFAYPISIRWKKYKGKII